MTNYGSNLVRGYQNPADPASCTLTIVKVQTNVKGLVAVKNSSAVNFTTRYDGGKELITRNMELKSVMEPPAYKIMQECPHVTNLTELKNRHDTKAKSVGLPIPPPRDVNSAITEFDKDHESFSNYQLQQGIYKLSPKGDSYVVTDKAFSRGIQNHFNPFARRISITTILFSALIGAVLPLYGVLKLAPLAVEKFGTFPHSFIQPATLAILICYALTGVLLGLIAESQNYVWIMLITYIPAHLVAGWTFGAFPNSTIAFMVSYFVCQAKRKRQLVLQS